MSLVSYWLLVVFLARQVAAILALVLASMVLLLGILYHEVRVVLALCIIASAGLTLMAWRLHRGPRCIAR